MLPRLVTGYIVALCLIVPLTARSALELPGYTIAVTMQSEVPGHLQVFYDAGEGYSEPRSAVAALQPSDEPQVYRLSLPPGRYRSLRIDPGTAGGRYAIERISILAPDGSVHSAIPILRLAPFRQISVLEQAPDRLVVEAPPGSDPQLVYSPDSPVVIPGQWLSPPVLWLFGRIALLWVCGIAIVWLIELGLSKWGTTLALAAARAPGWCAQNPSAAISIAAVLSTTAATYPILFCGQSLVAPNNTRTPMLYADAPFTPGSTDLVIGDSRGSDVWAALLQEIPHSNIQREALAAGEVPLWNRYNAGGRPLWGQGLTSVLDPLHWLTFLTHDPSLGWDIKFVAHRVVFALGIGLAAFAATGAWLPAVIVTCASPFIGVYTYRLNHPAAFALTYAPWILLAWFKLAVARERGGMAAASALLALSSALVLVAGTPKEAAVILLAVEMIGAITVLLSRGSWRQRGSRLRAATVAGVAGLLITAPHWLVFLDTLAASITFSDTPNVYFADGRQAVAFFLGPLMPGWLYPGFHLLGLVLTMAAITAPKRLMDGPGVLACGLVAGVLMAIGFGAVPASVIVRIPLLGNIGHVSDAFPTAAVVPFLILSAFGAKALLDANRLRSTIVAMVVGAVSWWLSVNARDAARDGGLESLMLFVLVPVAIALPGCFYAARHGAHGWVAIGLASFVLLLPGGVHAETKIPVLDDLLLQPRLRAALDQNSPAVEAIHHASTEPSRAIGLNWTLSPGSQAFYELESIGGADALEIRVYRELVDAAKIRRSTWITLVREPDLTRLSTLLDVLNVGFVIAPTGSAPHGLVDVPLSGPDRVRVERRATAWPRAFFVDGVTTYSDAPNLLRRVAAAGKPLAAVQSSDPEAIAATRGMRATSSSMIPARDYEVTVNTTSFIARASGPGVAVLGETFLARDFRATLNGQPVLYFRVNHAFKAVAIPAAGEWVVKFEYRPRRWDLSLAMAGVGMVLLAGLAVSARRPRYFAGATFSEKPAARASS